MTQELLPRLNSRTRLKLRHSWRPSVTLAATETATVFSDFNSMVYNFRFLTASACCFRLEQLPDITALSQRTPLAYPRHWRTEGWDSPTGARTPTLGYAEPGAPVNKAV
jgi:hypothetical protein